MWSESAPREDMISRQQHGDDTELDETRAAILRLMAEGEKDGAISRRLSISVRRCLRHIAGYMAQVAATCRFQAGVIAARAGHIDTPSTCGGLDPTVLILLLVLLLTNLATLGVLAWFAL